MTGLRKILQNDLRKMVALVLKIRGRGDRIDKSPEQRGDRKKVTSRDLLRDLKIDTEYFSGIRFFFKNNSVFERNIVEKAEKKWKKIFGIQKATKKKNDV